MPPNRILMDIPESFDTERLTIRGLRYGDGVEINAAIVETYDRLHQWMDWAQTIPTVDDSEEVARRMHAKFMAREDFGMRANLKGTETLVAMTGLHVRDWSIPAFEIGYWCRKQFEGQGYVTEAVRGITRFAFDVFKTERLIIRCDSLNARSAAVARRAGFTLEGTLRHEARTADGKELRDTLQFSLIRADMKS